MNTESENSETPRVLFICTENYYRSRFAEALFNYQAELIGLPWRAFSRGLAVRPTPGEIHPAAQDALLMRGVSLEYTSYKKNPLTRRDLECADRIIAIKESEHRPLMRLYFPDWMDRIEYWSSNGVSRMGSLGRVERLVDKLIMDLSRQLQNDQGLCSKPESGNSCSNTA